MPGCYAVAHRGLSSEVTENTLAAFQAAAAAGFRAFELDVRLTHDGEVVVLHDAAVERTTRGNGRVADLTYDELRGSLTPHGPIPRLDDLLAAMQSFGGLWNLEVKAARATGPTLDLVEHHGLMSRVLVTSFDPQALAVARDAAPAVARGLILAGPLDAEDLAMAADLECRWANVEAEHLDAKAVSQLHTQGLKVGAWTVNQPAEAKTLASRGVDAVITDVRSVLAALGDATPFL